LHAITLKIVCGEVNRVERRPVERNVIQGAKSSSKEPARLSRTGRPSNGREIIKERSRSIEEKGWGTKTERMQDWGCPAATLRDRSAIITLSGGKGEGSSPL